MERDLSDRAREYRYHSGDTLVDRPLNLALTASERKTFQADLTQCRTYAERLRLFQAHILEESSRIRGGYDSGSLSPLNEFSGRTAEWISFLLKEAFWLVFEETAVTMCVSPEQANMPKEAALFWKVSVLSSSPSLGASLELFILFCDAPSAPQTQFLTAFYEKFSESLERLLRPSDVPPGTEEFLFGVKVHMEPVFDFKRRHFSSRQKTVFSQRLAWLKFKAIAGATSVLSDIEAARLDFVYSPHPILFKDAALDRIRRQQECSAKANARFSPGGLLDIEYLTAALQMSFGSRMEGDVRSTDTLTALYGLWQSGALGEKHYQDLRAAYVFLTGLAGLLETGRDDARHADLPELSSEEFIRMGRRMGCRGPDAHVQSEFRLACQHHMSIAERLYTEIMVNLANQDWDQIPAAVVISRDSVRIRLDELLRGAPRPEDVPALRRMGFREIHEIGRRFQALCPNMTAFEPFSRVVQKSWELWPEIPDPDRALENLKLFSDENEDAYRFWYALAKSDKGLRLLLHLFGTSDALSKLFLKRRECWPWVEQTAFLSSVQTLERLQNPGLCFTALEELHDFKERETLRLALTDLFMGEPFEELMQAHSRLISFVLSRLSDFISGSEPVAIVGLGGTGSGASCMSSEWNFKIVAGSQAGLERGREWFEKMTGDVGVHIWTHVGTEDSKEPSVRVWQAEDLAERLRQAGTLSLAAPWLQMTVLAGETAVADSLLRALRESWREPRWLEPQALKTLRAERLESNVRLQSRHEEERDLVLAPGGLRDIEWVITAAWSRRARENFQPCGLLNMLSAVQSGHILDEDTCVFLKEAFLEYQKIRTRLGYLAPAKDSVLPQDGEDFRVAAKAAGFRDQGIHAAETLFNQHLTHLRQRVCAIFEAFFKESCA